MADDSRRELWCLIKNNSTAFRVTPLCKASIDELKGLIWEKRKNGVLRDVDATDLVLWKVSSDGLADSSQLTSYLQLKKWEPAEPLDTLPQRIASREVDELKNPYATVLQEFPKERLGASTLLWGLLVSLSEN